MWLVSGRSTCGLFDSDCLPTRVRATSLGFLGQYSLPVFRPESEVPIRCGSAVYCLSAIAVRLFTLSRVRREMAGARGSPSAVLYDDLGKSSAARKLQLPPFRGIVRFFVPNVRVLSSGMCNPVERPSEVPWLAFRRW